MSEILEQLGLDQTFYIQLIVFLVLFVVLSRLYFKPFLALFEARHRRTVQDREAAETLLSQAQKKLEEYQKLILDERISARKEYEALMLEVKTNEAEALAAARTKAKQITQEALDSVNAQRVQIQKQLTQDVETLATQLSEKLLSRRD